MAGTRWVSVNLQILLDLEAGEIIDTFPHL